MITDIQRAALKQIAEAAVVSERCTGGLPGEISMAQAILESGYLAHLPPESNNCFGIKDTDRFPGSVYTFTKEFIDGSYRTLKLAFEKYPSLADCFTDHAQLLHRGVYAPAWLHYQQGHNLDRFITEIAAHYATDPLYAGKVQRLAHGPNVTAAIAAARSC